MSQLPIEEKDITNWVCPHIECLGILEKKDTFWRCNKNEWHIVRDEQEWRNIENESFATKACEALRSIIER